MTTADIESRILMLLERLSPRTLADLRQSLAGVSPATAGAAAALARLERCGLVLQSGEAPDGIDVQPEDVLTRAGKAAAAAARQAALPP